MSQSDPENGEASSQTSRPQPYPWRMREAAQTMLEDRTQLDQLLSNDHTKDSTLYLSYEFDADAALDGVQKEKKAAQAAFTMAALEVLSAIRYQIPEQDDCPKSQQDQIPNLPEMLKVRQDARDARIAALQRSLDNKEWSKKKTKATVVWDGTLPLSSPLPSKASKKRKASTGGTDGTENGTANEPVSAQPEVPKFTRNTPASSAAALDHRFTNSRAILCSAGNIALSSSEVAPADVPQKGRLINLGAVVVDATVYGRRTLAVAENAVRRAKLRYQFRQEQARAHYTEENDESDNSPFRFLSVPNLFMASGKRQWFDIMLDEANKVQPFNPNIEALSDAWATKCRPRLHSIMQSGAGHALYYDVHWNSRHGRLADFLRTQTPGDEVSWGPHLIIATQPEVPLFCQEFHDWRTYLSLVLTKGEKTDMRAMQYTGTSEERRQLRRMWPKATGLPEDPIHVVVMSYTAFLKDYLHVCQLPWGTVIVDDGASWMAAGQGDPNASLASIWDHAMWSSNDHHTGLAGTTISNWDFESDSWKVASQEPNSLLREAYIGLTARHRIMTASRLAVVNRHALDPLPISGIVNFIAPHFASVVREEWDRNNIAKDAASMAHFRSLVARFTVVHHPDATDGDTDMKELAEKALEIKFSLQDKGPVLSAPLEVSEEDFVTADKLTFSRRSNLAWLGSRTSWLRFELGQADFQPILDIMNLSTKHGHYCEEVTTASSMTTSGATGQVAGSMAYRLAVRCGRHFGSEQGLRQHISAQHAPPGTWLCRTCGSDCITSQARTHHERACGLPLGANGSGEGTGTVGATPTVGQGGVKSGVGKKKNQRSSNGQAASSTDEEKDPDGSIRVPGYRGVWVSKEGTHFVKIDGKRYASPLSNGVATMFFESTHTAAKKYDVVVGLSKGNDDKVQLNFKEDGTRNVYEDSTSTTASGLGGSAANVVPLLSVINIKDLPPDVKPLLRDPRQTSRTGGNSKRHVYAYRGVCRQARKGHDRWQSQISFMGVNHYLGTFDSEWDAAAIYAWAHLILYGEEATRLAQKEGEEAAEAYEQEKRDIASGEIPAASPKPEKKKKLKKEPKEKSPSKKQKKEAAVGDITSDMKSEAETVVVKKRKVPRRVESNLEKKDKVDSKLSKAEREELNAVISKSATKAQVLGPREKYASLSDAYLRIIAARRLHDARKGLYNLSDGDTFPSSGIEPVRPCLPVASSGVDYPIGAALLLGIPARLVWSLTDFLAEREIENDVSVVQMLAVEYDDEGVNERFRSVMQGSVCIIGQASKRMLRQFQEIGGGAVGLGCGVGELDCHIGGAPGTCSPRAACVRYDGIVFRLSCMNGRDIVTLNGEKVRSGEGVILFHNDIISVGPRVFAFVLPNYKWNKNKAKKSSKYLQ